MEKKKAEELIEELKVLIPKTDADSSARAIEIIEWFGNHSDDKTISRIYTDYIETSGVGDIELGVENMRKQIIAEQIDDDIKKIIPFSVIAKYYFKKSTGWLSQRINGTPVRGKVYTLNDEQKKIFNDAVRDIAKIMGSFQIA